MTTDADRIMAEGVPLTLKDKEVRLTYNLRALKKLTDLFGGWSKFQKELSELEDPIGTTIACLAAGSGLSEDELYDQCELEKLAYYQEVISQALTQAFPKAQATPEEEKPTSPGASSTTSAPASLDGQTVSSGV